MQVPHLQSGSARARGRGKDASALPWQADGINGPDLSARLGGALPQGRWA